MSPAKIKELQKLRLETLKLVIKLPKENLLKLPLKFTLKTYIFVQLIKELPRNLILLESLDISLVSEFNALLPKKAPMQNFIEIAIKLSPNDFQEKLRKSQLEI